MTIQPGESLYTRSSQNQQKITGLTIRLMIPQDKERSTSSLAVRFVQCTPFRAEDDPEDKQFVKDLIEELEGRRGLRLYVPGRDDLLGTPELINNAGEIERRWMHITDS
ncbi:hypothetical protein DPMN_056295 [Dreissena polymorpha]|uniref:Uncharacterized protein n=1 Tax=Dreissena polymorpha TaxID=45954 RepID=A0A9D4CTD4_DREPO|nr:hypothetical protein DPMN_056295 [Dreissena polymorpha]